MPKTAFLFPGQGSQKAGMGLDLAEACPSARAVFDEADDALGFALSKLCFEGPDDELKLTENTQPAILTCSIAALAVLRERGFSADYVAGHSLGEYSALVAAGAIGFRDAVKLVRKRGGYMQEAVPAGEGAMAALIGLEAGKLEEICRQAAEGQVLSPANLNSPGQVVIAGHAAAVERAVELAKRDGARKAVLLEVSAPFHCSLMEPAGLRLASDLDSIEFRDLEIPLVNNCAAREVRTGEEAREGLKLQVTNPVRWEASIRRLAAAGVTRFLEAGPGKVLRGLVRRIDRSLQAEPAGTLEAIEKLAR